MLSSLVSVRIHVSRVAVRANTCATYVRLILTATSLALRTNSTTLTWARALCSSVHADPANVWNLPFTLHSSRLHLRVCGYVTVETRRRGDRKRCEKWGFHISIKIWKSPSQSTSGEAVWSPVIRAPFQCPNDDTATGWTVNDEHILFNSIYFI